jgi:hypothetical protein
VRERWGIGDDLLVDPDLLRVTTKPVDEETSRSAVIARGVTKLE